ncbi:SDR family NAD(P)-dependent oxidoreductase [Sphingobium subterraneum]|uniref:NAD(P)-dependent dehydrogenase (Short-subunit alcohol dehydrogenase family) n=1 Tax=Sphingobium subterraneum TaxID=627688 RepID=A0A841J9L8_9SPHN|nr:SDR family oxidoreductase [Sphingobium subterraneum]MBB6125248.1 NAD(P)-dependent dehydrogenase (short-subunit alcohol dehydrogenase family) [Sphingobium subterraneum]
MYRLKNRKAFITGGSEGIGAAIARLFAREGADILLMARNRERLDALVSELSSYGVQATALVGDLTDRHSVTAIAKQVAELCIDGLDIFVANGAISGPAAPIAAVTPDQWNAVFQSNVLANVQFLHIFQPLLQRSDAGRVVFLSSGAAKVTRLPNTSYAATKASLEAIARIYAADNDDGSICANIINPGPTRTDMRARHFPNEDPMTLHTAEDVAELVLALAEPGCTQTGQTIDYMSWAAERALTS